MKFQARTYRKEMEKGRFMPFAVKVEESDLWIGISNCNMPEDLSSETESFVFDLRQKIKTYINDYPDFLESHIPVPILNDDDIIIKEMKQAAIAANTGPMAAVAGLVASETLHFLEKRLPESEIIVENGGDIFLKLFKELIVTPFAGRNMNFNRIGLRINPDYEYLSICASSGMFGHSFSYGKADLVSVISKSACLADAYATSFANKVQNGDDLEKTTKRLPENVIGILVIKEDRMAYNAPFPMVNVN